MPSLYDMAFYGLMAIVGGGTIYFVGSNLIPESWPEGTPESVKDACWPLKGTDWCELTNAIAWATDECSSVSVGEYESCVTAAFEARGQSLEEVSSDVWPIFWGKDSNMWEILESLPNSRIQPPDDSP